VEKKSLSISIQEGRERLYFSHDERGVGKFLTTREKKGRGGHALTGVNARLGYIYPYMGGWGTIVLERRRK